jgi:hypothetical protein
MGLSAFNVQSTITYASTTASGKRVLVQLLNYYNRAVETPLTLRVNGVFRTAHLYVPENEKVALAVRDIEGRTETALPRLAAWAAVLLE